MLFPMSSLLWNVASEALVFVPTVLAEGTNQNKPVTKIELFNPLKNESLDSLLATILQGLTALAIPVVTIMIIIGAYYLITAGGNPSRVSKGKDYILWAVVGFAVLLLATSITTIISNWIQSTQGP